jgi:hypothetical protein
MKNIFFTPWFSFFLLLFIAPAYADSCTVSNDFWLKPRSGNLVLTNPDIAPCIHVFLNEPQSDLRIAYPDNDESAVDANELRQWLIALALPATHIHLQAQTGITAIQLDTLPSSQHD